MGVNFNSRMDLIDKNYPIIKDIFSKLPKNSITILTTNPVDIMVYLALKVSKNKREKIFGMGSLLDTYRLRTINQDGKVIGEHGDSMVFIPEVSDEKKDSIRFMSKEVSQGKGGTQWAPAAALTSIVECIIRDKKMETLASVYLNGEYGMKDICIGVPVIIGRNGVEKIIEMKLKPEEINALKKSGSLIKENIEKIIL